MKSNNILIAACALWAFSLAPLPSMAQTATGSDQVAAVKKKNLETRKADLQKQIAAEDKKRDMIFTDVSPKNQERLNEQQDSICLQLRSELVNIELEIGEIDRAAKASPQKVLQQAHEQTFRQEVQQALKPGKKPTKTPAKKQNKK